MISTSYPSVVDLVKLDLFHIKMPLFTHEGVKSSSYYYYFHIMNYFILIPEMYGPPYPFIQLLSVNNKNQINNHRCIAMVALTSFYTNGSPLTFGPTH